MRVINTLMPRPRILREPSRIHLTLERRTKDKARKLASGSGISVAQLVALLINRASQSEIQR